MVVECVWFDLGYTLVYLKREENLHKILLDVNIDIKIDRIKKAYYLADKFFMREHRGLLCKTREEFMPVYLKKLLEFLNLKVGEHEYLTIVSEEKQSSLKDEYKNWIVFDGVKKVLTYLRENSIKLGLISNWDNTAMDVLKHNGLDEFLDEVVISSEVGYLKPDKRIFDYAIKKARVDADKCLFVGDNYYDDVEGSSKVGMKSVLINPYGKFGIEELEHKEIISDISELPQFINNIARERW